MPSAVLPAAPNRQPGSGIIALSVTGLPPDGPWAQGITFDVEPCDDGVLYASVCQVTTEKALVAYDDRPDPVEYLPVLLIAADRCSTLSRTTQEAEQRANRLLLNVQSHQLEVAFWVGEATDDPTANGGDRPHLADGTAEVIGGGPVASVPRAIGLLDQALSDCLHGVAGMAHMTPYAQAQAAAASALHRENGQWYTPAGHLVVAGSGYEGIGPRSAPGQALPAAPSLGGDQWAYGTPMVTTLLSDVVVNSDVDWAVNDVTARAERYGAAFHGPCCKFAIQLDLAP